MALRDPQPAPSHIALLPVPSSVSGSHRSLPFTLPEPRDSQHDRRPAHGLQPVTKRSLSLKGDQTTSHPRLKISLGSHYIRREAHLLQHVTARASANLTPMPAGFSPRPQQSPGLGPWPARSRLCLGGPSPGSERFPT